MSGIDIKKIKNKKQIKDEHSWTDRLMNLLNKDISFGNKTLNDKKKLNFYNDLSILLSSGIDLHSTLDLMCDEVSGKDEKDIYINVRNNVLNGASLSEAMERTEKFSIYEYYSLKIGEESGCLMDVLQDLVNYFTKKIEQKRKMSSAFSYPIIVLATAVLAVIFMMSFVVPMFEDVFKRFGNDLPYITKITIKISHLISTNISVIIVILVALFLSIQVLKKNEKFKKLQSLCLLHIPFIGEMIRKMYLARFCLAMSLLTGARTPLLNALGLVKQMIVFYPLQKSIAIIENDILHGKSLYESMAKFTIYDRRMISLVKVAEEVNQLDTVFNRLKIQYMDDVDYQTGTIGNVLEPLMIILIGIFVGVILVAMYLPMFKLSTTIAM